MTDTSKREELTEEAAKAIAEFASSEGPRDAYHLAKVLYVLFEQAHAKELDTSMEPVKKIGDSLQVEREELARWLHVRFGKNQTLDWDLLSDRLKDGWRDIANDAPRAAALRRTAVQEPQGEPTDAQVLAALVEWSRVEHEQHRIRRDFYPAALLDDYGEAWVERMRAALRAAAATQTGEQA
jgi:hypothetical protein